MFIGSCEWGFLLIFLFGGFGGFGGIGGLGQKGEERRGDGKGRILLVESFAYFLRVFFRYYEGGVSSVYFWDLDDGFAGVVLLKKSKSVAIQVKGWEVDVDICSYADGEE